MKEELQTKLVEILGSIQTAAGKAGDFAMTQLPDIAQQYVFYGRAVMLVACVLLLAVVIGSAFGIRYTLRHKRIQSDGYYKGQTTEAWDAQLRACWVVTAGASIVLCVVILTNLMVWFAPKVWLLKEIAGLIK